MKVDKMMDGSTAYKSAASAFETALRRIVLGLKYAESHPRVPAGNPGGGQWTSGGGGGGSSTAETDAPILLAGGFEKEDMGKTVQQFMSDRCTGRIRAVMPGQFLDMTIADVLRLATTGDAAARHCKKILDRDDYRK